MDIVIPEERWKGVPRPTVARYLLEQIELALQMAMKRIAKDKLKFDNSLLTDFARLKQEFLSEYGALD